MYLPSFHRVICDAQTFQVLSSFLNMNRTEMQHKVFLQTSLHDKFIVSPGKKKFTLPTNIPTNFVRASERPLGKPLGNQSPEPVYRISKIWPMRLFSFMGKHVLSFILYLLWRSFFSVVIHVVPSLGSPAVHYTGFYHAC
jgi:hypothetical protein